MDCMKKFLQDSYQYKLRLYAQSKSECYEDAIENYKKIFLAHLEIVKSGCTGQCSQEDECNEIRRIVCEIKQSEIENFFDELKNVYLCWINADISKALRMFRVLLRKYKLYGFKKKLKKSDVFFKGRISDQVLTSWDMFHIPFNKRYLIKNQRYSLTGQPMLYIGKSVIDVIKELEVSDIRELKLSSITFKDSRLTVFDLTSDIEKALVEIRFDRLLDEKIKYNASDFFKTILASVCSFQKRQELKGFSFCEEYVLPQMLAQILKTAGYAGIAYSSTKRYDNVRYDDPDDDSKIEFKENIAIFTNLDSEHVYDRKLYDQLSIGVPIDVKKIESISEMDLEEVKDEISQSKDQNKITRAECLLLSFQRNHSSMKIDNKEYGETEYGKLHLYELYMILNQILVE